MVVDIPAWLSVSRTDFCYLLVRVMKKSRRIRSELSCLIGTVCLTVDNAVTSCAAAEIMTLYNRDLFMHFVVQLLNSLLLNRM